MMIFRVNESLNINGYDINVTIAVFPFKTIAYKYCSELNDHNSSISYSVQAVEVDKIYFDRLFNS